MGYSAWNTDSWARYSASASTKTTADIFKSTKMVDDLNPHGVKFRESRDSTTHPNSTAMIVACDVTGSMGIIADHLVRKGIGTLFEETLSRKPITDPHLMIMGVGDADYDKSPLQVSQFEADLKIAEWLEKIHIEHGGGGNDVESYDLPYYFAYYHTAIDCFEKRRKKGFLFTIGDEEAPKNTEEAFVKKIIGDSFKTIPFKEMYDLCSRMYHCYHLMIAQGDYASRNAERVKRSWMDVMGQHAVWVTDYTKLSEVVTSLIQVTVGEDKEDVVKSWSGDTSLVVRKALDGVSTDMTVMSTEQERGIRRF